MSGGIFFGSVSFGHTKEMNAPRQRDTKNKSSLTLLILAHRFITENLSFRILTSSIKFFSNASAISISNFFADLSKISTVNIASSKTSLLNKLELDDSKYKAAIACDDQRCSVKLLSADESYAFISKLLRKALNR